jgi:hypothetical protein
MADNGSILVSGGAGQLGAVGRTVTGLLLERGLPVHAMKELVSVHLWDKNELTPILARLFQWLGIMSITGHAGPMDLQDCNGGRLP